MATHLGLQRALLQCFIDNPGRVFGIQDLVDAVQLHYDFTDFQEQNEPVYGQPRYRDQIRSATNRLKQARQIERLGRDRYRLRQSN